MTETEFTPIKEYGFIGNLETCALVAPNGSVDWFPFPHVEGASILAAILDPERGGRFQVSPAVPFEGTQQYVERTNVLETTFDAANGTATVTDFFPPAGKVDHPKKVLYRKVTCAEGSIDLEVEYEPGFDYGRADPAFVRTEKGIRAEGEDERTLLEATTDLEIVGNRVTGTLAVEEGDTEWLLLRCTGAEDADADPEGALEDTVSYWEEWVGTCSDEGSGCIFEGPWHDLAVRSGLALKLLTHEETGAIAAAPTTSLPEDIGGVRNWDYRFNWLRDAGFTVQALSSLGNSEGATEYFEWYMNLCQADEPEKIQPLYGLHGESDLEETELEHLNGYRNSRPVRIGNGAADQTQLDIYGELLLAVDEVLELGRELDDEEWDAVHDIVEYVREVWDDPDAGIWEVRGPGRQFVYSKVMCWVALDRGIDIATTYGYEAPVDEWRDARETIKEDVLENGYDEDTDAFVQAYGSDALDATGLLIPIVGFLPFDDERVQNTIDAIEDRLLEGDVLVKRYDGDDGLPGDEGAFVLCSCWLIDALALSGRVEEAVDRFESLIEYVSPLGLLAEEIDADTGEQLGNFPQAFSHIGLVNSALYLGHVQGYESPGAEPMGIRLGDSVSRDDG
ncbi:glycoside hydrolase family 15 protein [Halopelagius longus]|uniref:Glucoamylase (Glucan-1,4-alpha-glucosidase), GH15 family n=1 Tax=Halopelagius longus TaxID=1236180 RepID=A0A1H1GTI1_9EURY|nr:glycoside hydrolase family 15 protein [Halopelagius longus]RDI69505.1 glycoside hydrolase family 15 protein [Halopelagius longus]SDR16156.1 Glucoamylase (glucan-1,4-alpha-glucosidase), GH15 family [Halopelagius longus]